MGNRRSTCYGCHPFDAISASQQGWRHHNWPYRDEQLGLQLVNSPRWPRCRWSRYRFAEVGHSKASGWGTCWRWHLIWSDSQAEPLGCESRWRYARWNRWGLWRHTVAVQQPEADGGKRSWWHTKSFQYGYTFERIDDGWRSYAKSYFKVWRHSGAVND